YKQHGRDGAQAILGSIGTMVFLPGLDAETAQYAAKRIGRTTVLQHSVVDATGDVYDQDRLSETGRDLLDAAELRQMAEHTQAVAIIGSAAGQVRLSTLRQDRAARSPTAARDSSAGVSRRRRDRIRESQGGRD